MSGRDDEQREGERGERLQKVLARAGVASRRSSEKLIISGKVTVNGEVVRELGSRVAPGDEVRVEGTRISAEGHRYYLLYKPRGMVTTLSDPEGRPCVGELCADLPVRVFPVGRLDFDGEGLLLLTNDGALAEKAMHPRFHVPRIYEVKVRGVPGPDALERMVAGVRLDDGRARALEASLLRRTKTNTWVKVVVAEGRQHLVKRLCAAVGHPVQRLKRVQVGELALGELKPGQVREISAAQAGMATLEGTVGPAGPRPGPRPDSGPASRAAPRPAGKESRLPTSRGGPKPAPRPAGKASKRPAAKGGSKPAPRPAGKAGQKPASKSGAKPASKPRRPGGKGRGLRGLTTVLFLLLASQLSACADDVASASKKLSEDGSALIRAAAAERLGELGGAEALRVLTAEGLKDDAPRVRAASIRALEKQNNARLIDLFGDLLFDPAAEVQLAAAQALAARGDARSRRTLELAYGRAPLDSRLAIAAALTGAGVEPERAIAEWSERQLNSLLAAVRSDSVAERMGAAEQLGRSGTPEAVAALMPMLADRSVGVAASAARGLGWAGDPRAVSLLAALLDEPYPVLRRDAAQALRRIGSLEALPALAAAVKAVDDPTAVVYVQAIRALSGGAEGDESDGAEALCQALLDAPGPRSATLAAQTLVQRGGSCDAAAALHARLGGRDANLHAALAAIESLRGAGMDARQLARVADLLEDDDPRVVGEALAALAATEPEQRAEQARQTLAELLEGQRLAREEWVPGTLPTRNAWAVSEEELEAHREQETTFDDAYSLVGMETGANYRKRFDELIDRVAVLRAEREADEAARKGLGVVDVDSVAARNREALTGDVVASRVELVDDRPPELEARLAAACRAVGWAGSPADAPALVEALRTNGPEVQRAAAEALERLGPEVAPAVMPVLEVVVTTEVMAPLARLLDAAKTPAAELAALLPRVQETGRAPLLETLGNRGGNEAEALLIEALGSTVTAGAAATALGHLGTPAGLAALEQHVRDEHSRGRVQAFRALAARGSTPERAETLGQGLHDRDPEVRGVAAAALAGRQGPTQVWVDALRKDYDIMVRRALEEEGARRDEEGSTP
ncbi:MAG: pseudouridine synthase [Deltaproteobacteria bacterium]|nr:pseudouridine synthase [Deltaproteobacteria bacterium]